MRCHQVRSETLRAASSSEPSYLAHEHLRLLKIARPFGPLTALCVLFLKILVTFVTSESRGEAKGVDLGPQVILRCNNRTPHK